MIRQASEIASLLWSLAVIAATAVNRFSYRFANQEYLFEQAKWTRDGRAANESSREILRRAKQGKL